MRARGWMALLVLTAISAVELRAQAGGSPSFVSACYNVPGGLIYRVGQVGLLTECLPGHVPFILPADSVAARPGRPVRPDRRAHKAHGDSRAIKVLRDRPVFRETPARQAQRARWARSVPRVWRVRQDPRACKVIPVLQAPRVRRVFRATPAPLAREVCRVRRATPVRRVTRAFKAPPAPRAARS